MSSLSSRIGTRQLTIDELWGSWPIRVIRNEVWITDGSLTSYTNDYIPCIYPMRRSNYRLCSNDQLEAFNGIRKLKLESIREIINNFGSESNQNFQSLWKILQNRIIRYQALTSTGDIDEVFQQCIGDSSTENLQGVQAEKRENHRKALFHFALALAYLIPFHVDAYPAKSAIRKRLAKLHVHSSYEEISILDNIALCAMSLARIEEQHSAINLYRLAYSCTLINLTLYFAMTVGELRETFEQVRNIDQSFQNLREDSSKLLTDRTLYNISLMETCIETKKTTDSGLWNIDYQLPLAEIRKSEKKEIHTHTKARHIGPV
ncbi:uncharacterized protein L201_005278 [Kwoniella dendrophila CBS 6074]|uniref:Uncharacterized protein n=1 Tax=Kwoniella dendrophila CBS 6074 TaxID=1295534 RepID=A0AAX4K0H5_9TREE